MNKKVTLFLYYIGLLAGTLIINYILKYHLEYAESMIKGFRELYKMKSVNGQEVFFYLFLKRVKQMAVFCIAYFYISKPLTLMILDFYFACIEGMYLSICTYYYSIFNMIMMSIILLPLFLYFCLLEIVGWKNMREEKIIRKNNLTNMMIFLIISTIILTIFEILVNSIIGYGILNHI